MHETLKIVNYVSSSFKTNLNFARRLARVNTCKWEISKYSHFSTEFKNLSILLCYILHNERSPIFLLNILHTTGYVMHQQFYIQQLYLLPTLYLCVLYLSVNKQRLVPLTA